METSNTWYRIYWVVWVMMLPLFTGVTIWYKHPNTRRDRAGLSIALKQFVMHINLTPDEIKQRLTGAVEPFIFLRTVFDYKGNYEGQWLTADYFELHRLARRNALFIYLEIFPYLQNTTLVKVTLRTSTLGLLLLGLFGLNPILTGILVNAPSVFSLFCLPVLGFVTMGIIIAMVRLRHEINNTRAFLERLFAPI